MEKVKQVTELVQNFTAEANALFIPSKPFYQLKS